MTDKERIKAEIERLCARYNEAMANPNFASYDAMLIAKGKQRQREDILDFINSLPEGEDLSIAADNYAISTFKENEKNTIFSNASNAFKAGANWQKKQLMKQLAHMPWDKAMDYILKESEK